jgi:cytochrome b561
MSIATPKFRLNNVFKQLMSLHWWMAICYLLLFPTGIAMAKLEGKVNYRELVFATHKSFGVLVLLLLGWRVYFLLRVWGRKYSKHRNVSIKAGKAWGLPKEQKSGLTKR